jgi:hypothetical protein
VLAASTGQVVFGVWSLVLGAALVLAMATGRRRSRRFDYALGLSWMGLGVVVLGRAGGWW